MSSVSKTPQISFALRPWKERLNELYLKIEKRQGALPINNRYQLQSKGSSQLAKDIRRALKEGKIIQIRKKQYQNKSQTYLINNQPQKSSHVKIL